LGTIYNIIKVIAWSQRKPNH